MLYSDDCLLVYKEHLDKKYFGLLEKSINWENKNIIIFADTVECPNVFFTEN